MSQSRTRRSQSTITTKIARCHDFGDVSGNHRGEINGFRRGGIKRSRRSGFTLVELLVVIAIISILASIVVPNVTRLIERGKITKATAEIANIELAMSSILADTGRSSFRQLLNRNGRQLLRNLENLPDAERFEKAQGFYTNMIVQLLRRGKNISPVDFPYLSDRARSKLQDSYMEIGLDPWGEQYRIWLGNAPVNRAFGESNGNIIQFRSYREPPVEDGNYRYTFQEKQRLDQLLPGNPEADNSYGFPAPRNLPFYIYSLGPNLELDALLAVSLSNLYYDDFADEFTGGGDDINNWDTEAGWESAPR